jgi:hypothetical protein
MTLVTSPLDGGVAPEARVGYGIITPPLRGDPPHQGRVKKPQYIHRSRNSEITGKAVRIAVRVISLITKGVTPR